MEECTLHGPLTSKDLPSAADHPTRYEFENYRSAMECKIAEMARQLDNHRQQITEMRRHTHSGPSWTTTSPPTGASDGSS
jgi:hypothetical protein